MFFCFFNHARPWPDFDRIDFRHIRGFRHPVGASGIILANKYSQEYRRSALTDFIKPKWREPFGLEKGGP